MKRKRAAVSFACRPRAAFVITGLMDGACIGRIIEKAAATTVPIKAGGEYFIVATNADASEYVVYYWDGCEFMTSGSRGTFILLFWSLAQKVVIARRVA